MFPPLHLKFRMDNKDPVPYRVVAIKRCPCQRNMRCRSSEWLYMELPGAIVAGTQLGGVRWLMGRN